MAWKVLDQERVETVTVTSTLVTEEVSLLPTQDGYYDFDTLVWNDVGGGLISGQNGVGGLISWIGLQFQLYAGEQPTWAAPGVGDPSPFQLDLHTVPFFNLNSGTLKAYLVPRVNPVPYSAVAPNIPFFRGEFPGYLLGTLVYIGPDASTQTWELDYAVLQPYLDDPAFTGKISISFSFTASTGRVLWYAQEGCPPGCAPTLRVTQTTGTTTTTTTVITAGAWDRFYTTGYDWRVPENGEQHQSETQNPGALLLKPKNVTLKPIEIQVPAERKWDITDEPDAEWYVWGAIE